MPKITVEYSDEERRAMNLEGEKAQCASCPSCGDSMIWKQFHHTDYIVGDFLVTSSKSSTSFMVSGAQSVAVLCEECWGKLSIDERIPLYEKYFADRRSKIRRPVKVMTHTGERVELPKDFERYAREIEEANSQEKLAIESVKRGD